MRLLSAWSLLLVLKIGSLSAEAQALGQNPVAADTLHKYESHKIPSPAPRSFFKSKGFRAVAVPAVLIGYGISTINNNGFYSSYEAKRDIRRAFGSYRTRADDYLQFAPYFEIGGALLAGVDSRDDRINLGLVVLKGELIMLGSVFLVKRLSAIERPDSSANNAFPSGHTAQAFLAASIVHTELRDKSPWYGIGAYAIATSVAALRMVNNKHWQSDVVAGAGFGILSAHLAYLSHRNRWGRKPLTREVGYTPWWTPSGGTGITLTWRPRK